MPRKKRWVHWAFDDPETLRRFITGEGGELYFYEAPIRVWTLAIHPDRVEVRPAMLRRGTRQSYKWHPRGRIFRTQRRAIAIARAIATERNLLLMIQDEDGRWRPG